MGVNCLILLSADVRLRDAADVIGILAGLKASKRSLGGDSYSCEVDGVKLEASLPEMSSILLEGDLVDGQRHHSTTWHWEPDQCDTGLRLLYPRSNVFWVAVGKRLVDFFGGSIAYTDYDRTPDYEAKKPRKRNNPSDGKPWHDFQDEKLAIEPLTQADLDLAEQFAAYKRTPA